MRCAMPGLVTGKTSHGADHSMNSTSTTSSFQGRTLRTLLPWPSRRCTMQIAI